MQDIPIIAPDGTTVLFPAGTSDDVITQVMAAEFGGPEDSDYYNQPGITENNPIDLAGITPEQASGLVKGTWVRGEDGTVYALPSDAVRSEEQPGDKPVAPGVAVRPQGVNVGSDVAQSLGSGLVQGVTGLAGLPGMARNLAITGGIGAFNFLNDGVDINAGQVQAAAQSLQPLPQTGQLNTALQGQFGEFYEPQTMAGEYARTIGEFAPGAIVPGGIATKAASALVPALLSETAGQVAEKSFPKYEDEARVIGGLAGGFGTGGVNAVRGGPQTVIRNATRGVSPDRLAEALALRQRASSLGVPLTQAEALQQVTNGGTGLGRVQRVVEGSSSDLAATLSQRPQQVRGAVDNLVGRIGPAVDPAEASRLGQVGAEAVLNRMRQRVNASAADDYRAAEGQVVSAEEYDALQSMPTFREAEARVMGSPELRPTTGPQSIATINRVITEMDAMQAAAVPSLTNPTGNMALAATRESASGLAKGVASGASPELARARQTVATGREAFVDPLKRGPLGTIAGQPELRPTLPQQTGALFPSAPAEGQANQTLQALNLMNEVQPGAGPALTRQFLATQANEALQSNVGGPNQFGGAKLAAQLLGNPEQERALLGAIDQADPFNRARELAEVLRATGQREVGGSNTAFNAQLQQEIAGGNLAQEGARAVTNPGGIPGRVARAFDNEMTRRNAEQLAAFLTSDPEAARQAILRAQLNRSGSNRTRLAVALASNEEQ